MHGRNLILVVMAAVFLSFLCSCASKPQQIEADWTEETFFKNAQLAMDEYRYKTALFYYNVFLVRYPENLMKVIAAEYELAFLNYKIGNYEESRDGYNEIIRRYEESAYAMMYPPRFLELSKKGLVNIEKQNAVKNKLFWRAREKDWALENGETITDEGENPEG
jgi:tetratricopeptide (TPR) repeat protein